FVLRYAAAYPTDKVSRNENPGQSYDAFYLLGYATLANGAEEVTGASLARSFAKLVPQPGAMLVEVGPTGVFDGINALSTGRAVDLDGTQSGLDFDLATGEAPADFDLLCASVDSKGRASGEDVPSGLVYRASKRDLEGSLRCP